MAPSDPTDPGPVPEIDPDPAWEVTLPEEPSMRRASEAIGALANGWAGTRGAREEEGPVSPQFLVEGIYGGDGSELLAGPGWASLRVGPGAGAGGRRVLDLRTGVVARCDEAGSGLASLRFVSATRPGALALRAEGPASLLTGGGDLVSPGSSALFEREWRAGVALARTHHQAGGGITMAARDREALSGGRRRVERLAAWVADGERAPEWEKALEELAGLETIGFDALLAEHRQEWARRWADAEVSIDGDPEAQLAVRFAVFHLLSAAHDGGEAALGARGLTGPAYGGHVFWDADVFALPALAALRPAAARAMLEYRVHRLPAARAAAAARGLAGARFPWESAANGTDVTPRVVPGRHGEPVRIRTGEHEEHITADVAWAAYTYAAWSGDDAFLAGAGRDLLLDTARYWASRTRRGPDGRAHLYGVIGPDEYHEVVDDNAFTNLMARWNLRSAAALAEQVGLDATEPTGWRELADVLVDGWDPLRGVHEQFAGYFGLEPLLIAELSARPVAADVLLGTERVAGSQVIKQADVMMAHHLVPDELTPGSLVTDLAYYEPRTAHGSSLSPAIHAALLARAGRPEAALELFRVAAGMDLDDITGTTAGGLHLATIGGVWQALAYGFLGLRAEPGALRLDPCLPAAWETLALRLRFRGVPIGVGAEHGSVAVTCAEPVVVRVGAAGPERCDPPGRRFATERRKR